MKQAILWLVGLLTSGMVLAEPVAMVTDVSDGVYTIVRDKPEKLVLLSYFEPGTIIRLDKNAHLTATFLSKSVEYRFSGPARLTVEQDRIVTNEGKAETQAVSLQKTRAAKKFTAAQRESVAQAAFEMRVGTRPGLRLDDPVDSRVLGSMPVFNWSGPRSIESYHLKLFDEQRKLVYQTVVSSNSWTPQEGLLKEGSTYEWEIEGALGKGEVLIARARFSLAGRDIASDLQAPPADAPFSDRVLYAIYLEGNGFNYDARRIWKELVRARPDDMVVREHAIR
jgi:hypothetical protein